MDPIKVSNPLLELLSSRMEFPIPDNDTDFPIPNVVFDPSSFEGPSSSLNDDLQSLVTQLHGDDDPVAQLSALQAIENLVASPNDMEVKAKIARYTGALTGLLVILYDDSSPGFQVCSANIISHLANGNMETKSWIVDHPGALQGLVDSFSKDTNPALQQNAARALSFLAEGDENIKTKIFQEFVLKGLINILEDKNDQILQANAISTWRKLEAGGDESKNTMVAKVFEHDFHQLRRKCLLNKIPPSGDSFEGLGAYLLDLEQEEFRTTTEESHDNSSRQTGDGNQMYKSKQTGCVDAGKPSYHGKQKRGMENDKQWDKGKQRRCGEQTRNLENGKQWDTQQQTDDCRQTVCFKSGKQWDKGKQWDDGKQTPDRENCKQWNESKQAEGEDRNGKDDCQGCCSFFSLFLSPWLAGWPAWFARKGNSDAHMSPGERPVEILMMSLSEDLEGKNLRQKRNVLLQLCEHFDTQLDSDTASFVAKHPEVMMGLVSLLSDPSLRGPAALVLRNLAENRHEIMVTIVGLLVSLTKYDNPLQESAVWGLGSLAASNDGFKAEIMSLEHDALTSLVSLLRADTIHSKGDNYLDNYVLDLKTSGACSAEHSGEPMNSSLRTTVVMTLRNLATGDCKVKATICEFPEAIDQLASSLVAGVNNLPVDCDDKQALEFVPSDDDSANLLLSNRHAIPMLKNKKGIRGQRDTVLVTPPHEEFLRSLSSNPILPQNAALALANLAGGDEQAKASVVDHPGALVGLVLALERVEYPVLQQNAAFAFANLAAGDGQNRAKFIDQPGVLQGLVSLLWKDECRVPQINAAFALSNLAGGDEQQKAKMVDHPGLVEAIVHALTKKTNAALQKYAAKAIYLLSTGDSKTKSKIVNHPGALEGLVLSSLNVDNIGMRHYLKWAARNLAANDDVETLARTKVCNDLWTLFSQPANCSSPLPLRSETGRGHIPSHQYGAFIVLGSGEEFRKWDDYVRFGYISGKEMDLSNCYGLLAHSAKFWSPDLHLLEPLLEAIPKDMDAFKNGPILQRQTISNLCDAIPTVDNPKKITDHPWVLNLLVIILSEDSNPHLQRRAMTALKVLASSARTIEQPALEAALLTCLTNDKDPLLQERTLEAMYSVLKKMHPRSKARVANHSGVVKELVLVLTKDNQPNLQVLAYNVLRSLLWERDEKTQVSLLEHLTLLLEPGNSISFQYLASSIVLHLAFFGPAVEAVTKMIDLHPWVLETLKASLQPTCCDSHIQKGLCYFESKEERRDARVLPGMVLDSLLNSSDEETKAKIANYPGIIEVLATLLQYADSAELQERIASAVARLARGTDELKAKVVGHPGVLAGLLLQLPKDSRILRRTSALALVYLAQGTVQTRKKMADHPGLLAGLIMSCSLYESPVLQQHATRILLLLAEAGVETGAKIVYQPGALEWLLKFLVDDENHRVQCNSAFALRNLALAEEHREMLRETPGLVDGLQDLLAKEGPSLIKKKTSSILIVEKETPSPLGWSAAACALTLLDPVRGNGTILHTKYSHCGRGRANLVRGFYNEALEDLNKADSLQELGKPDDDFNAGLSRSIWRYRSAVKTKLGDVAGALEDAAKVEET